MKISLSDRTTYEVDISKPVKCGKYLAVRSPDHPKCWKNEYIYLHRIMAEIYILDRLLAEDEVVHHKDHDGHNNSIENLEVCTLSEHSTLHGKERASAAVSLICDECRKTFEREVRQTASRKGYKRSFCSRSCSGTYTRRQQILRARIPSVS